ncbi:MAG TPA: Gfo/Idh/MocA family oxidoreductase [Thermodesulfobacteriota bacterium]|nr:Gfo/Idh/MocA family oxidoreductase [Thermodesulfobacteriota bacterium]
MSVLRIGLLGFGRIAQLVHLNNLAGFPGAEFVRIAKSDPTRREEARRLAPKAAIFDDYHHLLKMKEMEAIIICLPHALQAQSAIAAFEAGKHVYLKKLIANGTADALLVLRAWEKPEQLG